MQNSNFKKIIMFATILIVSGAVFTANAQYNSFDSPQDGTIDPTQYQVHGNQTQYTITDNSTACRSLKDGKVVFRDIIDFANCTISTTIIPLLFSLAVLIFIWGIIQYVIAEDDEGKRKKAKDTIVYGIIGLFVMISIWGLVRILGNTFGVQNTIPTLSEPGN